MQAIFLVMSKGSNIVQNKAIRSLGEYLACGSTKDCFRDIDILNIDRIEFQQILIFVYQVLNGLSPQYFNICIPGFKWIVSIVSF